MKENFQGTTKIVNATGENFWPRINFSGKPIWKNFGCNNLVLYKVATRLKIPWICKVFYLV